MPEWLEFVLKMLFDLLILSIPILVLWRRQRAMEESTIQKDRAQIRSYDSEAIQKVLESTTEFIDIQESVRELTQKQAEMEFQNRTLANKVTSLEKSLKDLECLIREWYSGIRILVGQVKNLGGKPDWEPDNVPDWLKE